MVGCLAVQGKTPLSDSRMVLTTLILVLAHCRERCLAVKLKPNIIFIAKPNCFNISLAPPPRPLQEGHLQGAFFTNPPKNMKDFLVSDKAVRVYLQLPPCF